MYLNPTLALVQSFDLETKTYKLQCKGCGKYVIMYRAGSKDNDLIKEQANVHMKNSPSCIVPNIAVADFLIEEPL